MAELIINPNKVQGIVVIWRFVLNPIERNVGKKEEKKNKKDVSIKCLIHKQLPKPFSC